MLKICVLDLGYVGLPVALGISGKFYTIGFYISNKRIKELNKRFEVPIFLRIGLLTSLKFPK